MTTPRADDMEGIGTFESEHVDDAVPDELTDKANYFQSPDAASFCFPCLVAHLPMFAGIPTEMDDPWRRATDTIHLRCVSRAFHNVTEHLARTAVENRRTEISEMASL